jgi:hypothetical protein
LIETLEETENKISQNEAMRDRTLQKEQIEHGAGDRTLKKEQIDHSTNPACLFSQFASSPDVPPSPTSFPTSGQRRRSRHLQSVQHHKSYIPVLSV